MTVISRYSGPALREPSPEQLRADEWLRPIRLTATLSEKLAAWRKFSEHA
jgi:hypothetical protein